MKLITTTVFYNVLAKESMSFILGNKLPHIVCHFFIKSQFASFLIKLFNSSTAHNIAIEASSNM